MFENEKENTKLSWSILYSKIRLALCISPSEGYTEDDFEEYLSGVYDDDLIYPYPRIRSLQDTDNLKRFALTDKWYELLFTELHDEAGANLELLNAAKPKLQTVRDLIDVACQAIGIGDCGVAYKALQVIKDTMPDHAELGMYTPLNEIFAPFRYEYQFDTDQADALQVVITAPGYMVLLRALVAVFPGLSVFPPDEVLQWNQVIHVVDSICARVTQLESE